MVKILGPTAIAQADGVCGSLAIRIEFTMNFVLQLWQLLLAILAGWSNRQQQEVIEYLRTENQILKEKLGKRRILLDA
jgi:hypothetical protein